MAEQIPETAQMSPAELGPIYDLSRVGEAGMARRTVMAAGTLGLAVITGVGAYLIGNEGGDAHGREGKLPAAKLVNQSVDQSVLDALTVKSAEIDCVDVAHKSQGRVQTFKRDGKEYVSLVPDVLKPRVHSDDVATPFTSAETDNAGHVRETVEQICRDPYFGIQLANGFTDMKIGDHKMVEINDWLGKYQDVSKVNDQAEAVLPLLGRDASANPPSDKEINEAVAKNADYEHLAGLLATLVERFRADGVKTDTSTINLHVADGGVQVGDGKLPELAVNPTADSLPAFHFVLDQKTGECLAIFGLNLEDKRFELFKCVVKLPVTPGTRTRITTPGTTPGKTVPGTTPTTTLHPKHDDGQGIPGPGGDRPQHTPPPEGPPVSDVGHNPVGGTTPTTPEKPVTGTTVKLGGSGTVTTAPKQPPITAPAG